MDNNNIATAILAAGTVAITGIFTWGITKKEEPHKACIRECERMYCPKVNPDYIQLYLSCVQKCTGKDTTVRLDDP